MAKTWKSAFPWRVKFLKCCKVYTLLSLSPVFYLLSIYCAFGLQGVCVGNFSPFVCLICRPPPVQCQRQETFDMMKDATIVAHEFYCNFMISLSVAHTCTYSFCNFLLTYCVCVSKYIHIPSHIVYDYILQHVPLIKLHLHLNTICQSNEIFFICPICICTYAVMQ